MVKEVLYKDLFDLIRVIRGFVFWSMDWKKYYVCSG